MAGTTPRRGPKPPRREEEPDGGVAIDWQAVEELPEFRELVAKRRRFVVPATVFFLAWYFGFIVLAGYAEDFMGESIYEGFTVGYALALTQFVMVWVLGALYLRRSARVFDPLRERVVDKAMELARAAGRPVDDLRPAEIPAPRTEVRS